MYDVAIIGGGPGGYLAAERLGHEKKKVLLIEEHHLGGTCLNVGCIPTKTLLNSAKQYVHAKEAGKYGVHAKDVTFDWAVMQNWKNEVVEKLCAGIGVMMKQYGADVSSGRGEILCAPKGAVPGKVLVKKNDGSTEEHEYKNLIVCAGSAPAIPPIPGTKDNPLVVDSTGLLSAKTVPARLCVIGGGVIGVEFAGLFSSLGSQVTVIEMMDEIVPFMDKEQAPLLRRAMKGVDFKLGCKVEKIDGAALHYTTKDGKSESVQSDLILMAVGRKPVLDTWGAKNAGVDITGKGVNVDDWMRTNIPGIWAAGDVTGKSLLAHSAYRMAEVAAADILSAMNGTGNINRMRYNAVPWAVYGITEAAGVGMTEQEAAAKGSAVIKASLPMRRSGRFAAENTFAGQGAVKVIADADSKVMLGIHAVGAYASEFIWGGAALIEQELRIEDVKQLIFPHPTVCELIREAVWEL